MIIATLLQISSKAQIKPIPTTTRNFTNARNFEDLFKAMRVYYDHSKNLTQDGFINIWSTSQSKFNAENKLSVDCIARSPVEFYNERYVSDTINDKDPVLTIDFLTSKVSLVNYTLLYISDTRWMTQYEIWGEGNGGQLDLIDRRDIYSSTNPFVPPNGDMWTTSMSECNATVVENGRNVTKPCSYRTLSFPTINQKTYSKFRILNKGKNRGKGATPAFGESGIAIAKLLLYGTISQGTVIHSPIKLKRKEQMLFNFAMFSSLV